MSYEEKKKGTFFIRDKNAFFFKKQNNIENSILNRFLVYF